MRKVMTWIATGLGLGYSPFAPGTVGSLWGVGIVYAMRGLPLVTYVAVCVGLVLLAIPLCHVAEQELGKSDDGRIVADEFMTFPICMIGLYPYIGEVVWLLPMAFCSNRFFDILKLPPAHQVDARWKGGVGVTLDDAISSLYSLGANWAVFGVFVRWLA